MFEKLNQTDKVVIVVLGLTFLIFLINAKLALTALLYLNALCGLSLFLYAIWRLNDPGKILRRSLIIGAIASGTYLIIDRLFSSVAIESMKLITYLGSDTGFFTRFNIAPPGIVLNWVCLITIALYFYQRLRSFFSGIYIPMILTSISVFLASVILSALGNLAGRWNWNQHPEVVGSIPFIFSTPLFIPIAIALTFLLSPYLVTNLIAGGIRCAIVLGVMQFICFMMFRYFFI